MCVAGYFSQISTLADVQENVMRYLHVMSRPKVIDHEHDTVWTEAYVDSAVSATLRHPPCVAPLHVFRNVMCGPHANAPSAPSCFLRRRRVVMHAARAHYNADN